MKSKAALARKSVDADAASDEQGSNGALARKDVAADVARELDATSDELKLRTTLRAERACDADAAIEKDALGTFAGADELKLGITLDRANVRVHRERLPHWRQWGATYFVTSRLADSVPASVALEWRQRRDEWLRAHGLRTAAELDRLPERERQAYHREFTARFHTLLDAGYGECVLAQARCAELLVARLLAGHGKAYELDGWCIMPNHLHALVRPAERVTLGEIVRHWKGGSAHDINGALGRRGRVWQTEPFDHIVRSSEQLEHFRRYIAANPEKAYLREGYVVGVGAKVVKSFSS